MPNSSAFLFLQCYQGIHKVPSALVMISLVLLPVADQSSTGLGERNGNDVVTELYSYDGLVV